MLLLDVVCGTTYSPNAKALQAPNRTPNHPRALNPETDTIILTTETQKGLSVIAMIKNRQPHPRNPTLNLKPKHKTVIPLRPVAKPKRLS